ncbi:MAG: hormogonium polysaccharide secretion pseudopilin HpsC [Hassallia sp. WJT32-NPBG1]|jgi:type II secretory pathway pseudopilin PulG|nr:hormogonium polysaccharide secretion pseudopilin HpsC [Hassallia sp. WJT32-NPBG1]
MTSTLKFIFNNLLKRSRSVQSVGGFTLIELLVAMLLAFLVITPLLGFMINVMDTDRKEQAKANSEQEIQAALDYITRDLQQAIYIYDANGIKAIADTDATKSQLPPANSNRVPVLVFWKREFVNQGVPIKTGEIDDSFVYSLVAYYLIKDTNATWSKAARIARWQIKDGVTDDNVTAGLCTAYPTKKYVSGQCPDAGFEGFNLEQAGSLEDKMNAWKKASATYTQVPIALVDFIDHTATTAAPAKTCPTDPSSKVTLSQVPLSTLDSLQMTSFYACIDRVNTTAEVFLRGNALARMRNDNLNYDPNNTTYFPSASIKVQGHGYLFTK